MSPKRGIKVDQILEFPEQTGLIGLKMLATGGTEFFGTTLYSAAWTTSTLNSTVGNSDGMLVSWPIPIPEPITVDAMRINVQTAADAGDDVRLGIYQGDGVGGQPSTLVVQTADIPVDSTGAKTSTFTAVLLSPGLYWFAILGVNLDGVTNPVFRGDSANHPVPYFVDHDIGSNTFDDHAWGLDIGASSAMPDPFTSSAVWRGGNNAPGRIFVQARVA